MADDTTFTPKPEALSPASVFTPQVLVISSLAVAVILLASKHRERDSWNTPANAQSCPVVAIISRRKSTSRGDSLLLVGPSDAGKTAIFSTVRIDESFSTSLTLMHVHPAYIQANATNTDVHATQCVCHGGTRQTAPSCRRARTPAYPRSISRLHGGRARDRFCR